MLLDLLLILYGDEDSGGEYAAATQYSLGSSSRYDAGYTVDLLTPSYSADYGSTGYSIGSGDDTGLSAAYTLDTGTDRYSTGNEYDSDNYNGPSLGVPAYDEFYDVLS